MKWKDYGTPLVLGLLAGGAFIAWQPDLSSDPVLQDGIAQPCPNACYTWMFDRPGVLLPDHRDPVPFDPASDGHDRTFIPDLLVVRDDPAPFQQEQICVEPTCPTITWHTPYVGTVRPAVVPCTCPSQVEARILEDVPVDVENHTIPLEFYAFNDLGELLATNAPTGSLGRFRLYGDFAHWNTRPWYFGTGNVTGQVPEVGVEVAREALDGVPVGGIVTIHLERHEYDWLLGPVWITAQVQT